MNPALGLNGEWVGEGAMPSQVAWQLHVNGARATLAQFDEAKPQHASRFECSLSDTPATFTLGEPCEEFIGMTLDALHIVIAGLDGGNDVIFSRPGLAELTAHDIYRSALPASTQLRFALIRWAAA